MFIPLDLSQAVELKAVPLGRYDLEVVSCEETVTKEKNAPQYRMGVAILGHDEAPLINHYVPIPGADGDDAKRTEFKMLLLRRNLELFGVKVDPAGFDTSDVANRLVGCKAHSVEVAVDGDFNRINVPKLRGEADATGRTAPRPPKS